MGISNGLPAHIGVACHEPERSEWFVVEHSAHEAAVWEYCKGFGRFWKAAGMKPLGRFRIREN